jgi:hypothetical protein
VRGTAVTTNTKCNLLSNNNHNQINLPYINPRLFRDFLSAACPFISLAVSLWQIKKSFVRALLASTVMAYGMFRDPAYKMSLLEK